MQTDTSTEQTGYEQLRQRAIIFIRDQGGSVLEEALISHVFGSSGHPSLWRPLLRQVLAGDERLVLRSDGYWSVPSALNNNADSLPKDFVVVDVETTGLKPYQQRIIEIAAIRYVDGVRHDVYATLVNPERRLPAYISKLTGIDGTLLVAAPAFNRIAEQLLRFIGEDLIVGYNVGFDISFINGELKRLDKASLVNERLDLLPLSNQLMTGVLRPGLDGLCRALDIDTRERHRALADADVTALAFGRLLSVARERGLTSLDSLQRAAAVRVPVPKRRGAVGRGRAVLDRSHLTDIPRTPGVYLMHDAHDRVIYVGKAKNLRNRVSSYYSQPLGYTRKMDGLLESIARIDTIETGSELAALLLESQLILRYQPQFNRQQRNTESYSYIKVDVTNPWPRVYLTRQRLPDEAHYFGPFRVASAAKAAVELINDVFPLRSCTRSFRTAKSYGSPCLELSLGRCPGPCVGAADRDRYKKAVYDVISFLKGTQDEAITRLHDNLTEAADRLDFERAGRLRDRLRRVQQLVLSQQLLDETVERGNVVIVTPSPEADARELLLVSRGRLWAQLRAHASDSEGDIAYRLERAWSRAAAAKDFGVDHDSLDQVHILGRWLRKYSGHPAILPIDPTATDWRVMASLTRSLSDDDLIFEYSPGSDDEQDSTIIVEP